MKQRRAAPKKKPKLPEKEKNPQSQLEIERIQKAAKILSECLLINQFTPSEAVSAMISLCAAIIYQFGGPEGIKDAQKALITAYEHKS